ncbi:hypothetical protein AQUCO_04100008v1 [Aquilegia coerulea]|uniref:Uncharacterized protein n=1 Tax=Aquilegia coerulea TaxID=218851 RepID=A0A2G5CPQ2_AQUCA|nr:hypothetical protein AQUCO_04100008v1 [Aquilegia coerulea]
MVIKQVYCKEEKNYSLWHQLPYDILSLIIQRLEFMDYHAGVPLVCKNWRVACKKYSQNSSFPTPSDQLPWLMLRKSVTAPVLKFYRPLTNKTYKITSPAVACSYCLYSKDGWLLLHKVNLNPEPCSHSIFLFNIFTMDHIALPKLGISSEIQIHSGTFSNHLKTPNYVVIIARNRDNIGEIYAWRKGDSSTWKKNGVHGGNVSNIRNIWLFDEQLYFFTTDKSFTFDNDLNLKGYGFLSTNPSETYNLTVCENELLAFSRDNKNSNVYMFDRSAMDWVKVFGTNLICFSRYFNHSIGVVIRVQSDKQRLQHDLKSYGCKVTKREELIITDQVVYGRRDSYLGDNWIHVG